MNEVKFLCRVEEVPDSGAIAVRVELADGPSDLIVLREGDDIFAYYNECPHAGRQLDYAPGKFLVKGGNVMCAVHGASFAVASGSCVGGPARSGLVAVPIRTCAGDVLLA